ncbi:hypothetical protein ACFYXH_00880 [Streptomyces sp. NPDC002730]|uniref:hypothetical protein n=1 Tax=Streptomyces sp. NPDC002730 TaxID=3364662 RepID=UPI003673CEF8
MMPPKPMPTHDQDPDVTAAREAQTAYLAAVQTARSEYRLSDLAKAEAVDAAYTTYVTALQTAWDGLTERRRARLEHLEQLVPIGPGIPADATPADRAVLMTAFRAAFDKANSTDRPGRVRMLQDAERWDDDAARRGALTAIVDNSEWHAIRDWANQHLTTAGYLEEVTELRAALAGTSTKPDHRLAVQACRAVRPPQEVQALPQLIRLRDARETEGQRTSAAARTHSVAHSRFPQPGRFA